MARSECTLHGLPFGRQATPGWYVERCMHLGNAFVVDIRYPAPVFHAHIDLVSRDEHGRFHVLDARDPPFAEADWDWDTLCADLLSQPEPPPTT